MIPLSRTLLTALLMLTVACSRADALRVATTTTVDNSGLLDVLVRAYEDAEGIDLQIVATGSGQAFNLGRRGDVALVMTHEPFGERALVDEGLVRYYRKVMFNRFVIAGPPADPAGIAGAASAHDAMRRIAEAGTTFVSRGDRSGTHARELELWMRAGSRPSSNRLIETGQGMAPTLRIASERSAYVLTDEATLARLSGEIVLSPLFTGDASLLNTYAAIVLTTARPSDVARAEALARWLAEGPGQTVIAGFEIDGRRVFMPWPAGVDATRPESMPELPTS